MALPDLRDLAGPHVNNGNVIRVARLLRVFGRRWEAGGRLSEGCYPYNTPESGKTSWVAPQPAAVRPSARPGRHCVGAGDHELDRDRFMAVGTDVDVMGSGLEQPPSPSGAEILRDADVVAIHENLGCGGCNIENQPAHSRGLHRPRRRLRLCLEGCDGLWCVIHHHRPTGVHSTAAGTAF